ncbi:MAG: hypothetical protein U0872_07775 [Planctomycetaceae bacterium]
MSWREIIGESQGRGCYRRGEWSLHYLCDGAEHVWTLFLCGQSEDGVIAGQWCQSGGTSYPSDEEVEHFCRQADIQIDALDGRR